MKKAIISGATGLVGKAVVKYFSSMGIQTLCLSRNALNFEQVTQHFGQTTANLKLEMENIKDLREGLRSIAWDPGDDCVFFNFAWSGRKTLTDGGFDIQLINAINAANAVRAAKSVGCTKFVNAGTFEETYIELYLKEGKRGNYQSAQTDYALAKLASRDMCNIVAYMEKIDYVHTRLSVPLAVDLSQGGYVAQTLSKIFRRETYAQPENSRLFDIILIDDVARAYESIGKEGRNKRNYFIGTSRPATLSDYFKCFEDQVRGFEDVELKATTNDGKELFATNEILYDTGFQASSEFENLLHRLKLT